MYECLKTKGRGAFGTVYKARNNISKDVVAIKRVLQNVNYMNRELDIMKMINHPNIVKLQDNFFEPTKEGVYLNLVLEYVPHNLSQFCSQRSNKIPMILVKVYMYQLLRALSYIHSLGICHRDVKPQNLLINNQTHELKLCDFGSAKILVRDEPNLSYICSRYYRAPELIFGCRDYSKTIDLWSAGCVMAEMLLGRPLFVGQSQADQVIEIIRILGTPSVEDVKEMNPKCEVDIAHVQSHPWGRVFSPQTPLSAVDLITRLLVYKPSARIDPLLACTHPFFDELRLPGTTFPDGKPLPPLFSFIPEEIALAQKMKILGSLTPPHHCQIAPKWLSKND